MVFLSNTPMYGCTGMKYITEVCSTEGLCPKQQLIGVTWSVATKSQGRKLVFYTNYFLNFTLSPQRDRGTPKEGAHSVTTERHQMRELSQTDLCLWLFPPHNYKRSTGNNAGNRMEDFQILLKLAFCSAVMVRLCNRIVMFPRLCSNAATRWAWNQTTKEESVLFPQKGVFLQVFNQSTQCMALFVV